MRIEEFQETVSAHFSWRMQHHNWRRPVATIAGAYSAAEQEVFFGALLVQRGRDK